MSDSLGPIAIPDPPFLSPFPLRPDFGSGVDLDPPVAIHSFDQPGLKTEQRFLMGGGVRRFRFHKDHLSCTEYDQLKAHWASAQGSYGEFNYTHYTPARTTETVRVRYENPLIAFPHMVGMITGDPGLTLLEVPVAPFPDLTAIPPAVTRFPTGSFETALTAQAQHIIPLIAIQDRGAATTPLYLSDRRLHLDGTLYLPRLISWDGISQTLGEASDSARFSFGNADGVFTQLGNQINLYRALIQFALFHAESQKLIKLWSGYALPWSVDTEGHFELSASDGVFELGLAYPTRMITRSCWKVFKGRFCPSTSTIPGDCPKSWEACNDRGVPKSFGGVIVPAQAIKVKNNDTGTWGFGRSQFTSVTVAADTVYQRPVQEIYTDIPMVVTCDVAGGRDESEFYSALGIVGEGPISGYSTDLMAHKLDGQPPHDPQNFGGWRPVLGNDPAGLTDYVGISQAPWGPTVPPGATYSGGLAMAEIRRTDATGLNLSQLTERGMTVTVTGGIGGWTWTAPGTRVWTAALSNPIWVAVNVYLRAIGLRVDQPRGGVISAAQMEAFFDAAQAIAMAAVCDAVVPVMVGTGTEKRFTFRGILKERKPLKDWLQEILNCCLGFYTFVNGKLWLGIRADSSVQAHNYFTRANILFKSLQTTPIQPQFNWLVGQFGDQEFDWQLNNVTIYDINQASFAGTPESPQYNSSTMTLVGVSTKSQAARILTTRLREEIGGVGRTEQLQARALQFRTTILALRTMVGDIISLTHSTLPTGACEGRVKKWTLNPDFSIDIEAAPSTDSMYDLTFGPKPDEGHATPVPPEVLPSITGLTWMPNTVGPVSGDPLYTDVLQRTFDVWQDYSIARDGSWEAALVVAGEMCINDFAAGAQPRILSALASSGGTLNGPMTVYLAITQRSASNQPLVPSNLVGLWIPPGVTGQKVTLTVVPSVDAPGALQWDLWVGNDRRTIAWQGSFVTLTSPVTFLGPIHPMTKGLPEAAARKIAIAAKQVWHSGIAGVLVTGVTAPNQIQCDDFIGSTDNWLTRPISALADASDGSAPLWNFRVTAFDSVTGTLTVSPNCVVAAPEDSVQVGDVLIVRSIATAATATSVTDSMWNNSVALNQFGSPGLRPHEEIGRIARILFGIGAGQWRYITENTATMITVTPAWDVVPDASSVIIVEAPEWTYQTETSDLEVPMEGALVELRMRVENLRDHVALVAGFLVDDQARYSDEPVAPMREIYVFGHPPDVRVVGPGPGPFLIRGAATGETATDDTIRADTSLNDVTVELAPLTVYQGRTLLFVNDNGPHNLIVVCASGDLLFDGNPSVTLEPLEMVKVTAG